MSAATSSVVRGRSTAAARALDGLPEVDLVAAPVASAAMTTALGADDGGAALEEACRQRSGPG